MIKNLALIIVTNLFIWQVRAQVLVVNLRCEYRQNPLGVETLIPNLGWEMQSSEHGLFQTACRVLVSDQETLLQKGIANVWDSGKKPTRESMQFTYAGPDLRSDKVYFWRVMVWDNHGRQWTSTVTARWQMGILKKDDWQKARWVGYEEMPPGDRVVPAMQGAVTKGVPGTGKDILPLLRTDFVVKANLERATFYVSGLGQFEASLNGQKIGNHFLDPGWTDYDRTALYVPFDITRQLREGSNTLGLMLGNGMYYTPRDRYRKFTGAFGYPKVKCLLIMHYQDGSVQHVISDERWKAAPGPITFSSIYGGEDFDARLTQAGWNLPGYDDQKWKSVVILADSLKMTSQKEEPMRIMDTLETKKVTHPKAGVWVYDMGQNASGIPKITGKASKGTVIKITPGELLNKDGTVTQKATGSPCYYTYIFGGAGSEDWHPQFSYYGFRYLQIEKTDSAVVSVQSLHTRNSAGDAGHFHCSNELFNETFELIKWSIKSNMASVVTDCPTREKLGWLEQDHLMANSIRYNYDVVSLFREEIELMKSTQLASGMIPSIAPEYVHFGGGFRDSPEWGSTGVLLPWYVYQWYGDKTVLATNYDMIKRYVDYLTRRANNYVLDYGLGDWFDVGPKKPGVSQLTPRSVTATAYYFYDTKILGQIAGLLGNRNDEKKYTDQAKAIKKAYNERFFNKGTGNYATGSQTANALSLYMGLTAPDDEKAVVANIIADVEKHNYGITSGEIGFRYLLKVLASKGRSDVIFKMNNRQEVPGYGYQLAHGATSLTESWNADRSVSNNHLMLGHLMEWFYNDLAGIQYPDSTANGQFNIKPQPAGDVTFARADYSSPYGKIKCDWAIHKSTFELNVTIPVNTVAKIYFPRQFSSDVREKGRSVVRPDRSFITRGSGVYHFTAQSRER